jgi:hypothetical protein
LFFLFLSFSPLFLFFVFFCVCVCVWSFRFVWVWVCLWDLKKKKGKVLRSFLFCWKLFSVIFQNCVFVPLCLWFLVPIYRENCWILGSMNYFCVMIKVWFLEEKLVLQSSKEWIEVTALLLWCVDLVKIAAFVIGCEIGESHGKLKKGVMLLLLLLHVTVSDFWISLFFFVIIIIISDNIIINNNNNKQKNKKKEKVGEGRNNSFCCCCVVVFSF